MHAVVDAFAFPEIVAFRNGRLQVDDPEVGHHAFEFFEGITPRIREIHALWERSASRLRKLYIFGGIFYI